MTTCAVVDNTNTVINLIVAEHTETPPLECQLIVTPDSAGNNAGIGWIWNGSIFINPNPIDTSDYAYGN